jgi:REP element-mobilizing transposase RayT
MANYNTFIVVDCKSRKSILTTSSARKSNKLLSKGFRIDIWNDNEKICTIYESTRELMIPYINAEKEYIKQKQARAEARNKKRKRKGG